MNSRPALLTVTLAALLAASWGLRALVPASVPAGELTELVGPGGTLAALGGMRAAVAGGFWLRANLAWERRDAPETAALIGLTVAADERPLYFWLNGARMLAYDVPEWRLGAGAPEAVRRKVNEEQARQALALLEKGLRRHGADAAFYIEMGNIHLRRTVDKEAAARCYRQAAEQPGAPYYAARIHAELLDELGRPAEALAWLRQILPTLPAADPAARREIVLARIAALERKAGEK